MVSDVTAYSRAPNKYILPLPKPQRSVIQGVDRLRVSLVITLRELIHKLVPDVTGLSGIGVTQNEQRDIILT